MTVRVTRLMEYEFETVERALAHMESWAVPANGTKVFGPNAPVIRSAVIGPVFGEAAERIHSDIDAGRAVKLAPAGRAKVILFKPGGKYYTEEDWAIPTGAIGPYDMGQSPDFRRISGGPVLVPAQEPWGYPFLLGGDR